MILIDFLNKKIPGGGKNSQGGTQKIAPPPWLKSFVRARTF